MAIIEHLEWQILHDLKLKVMVLLELHLVQFRSNIVIQILNCMCLQKLPLKRLPRMWLSELDNRNSLSSLFRLRHHLLLLELDVHLLLLLALDLPQLCVLFFLLHSLSSLNLNSLCFLLLSILLLSYEILLVLDLP